jgi:D-beta-D-heptose 7-phosphate kinase/D-beta-D-heptose 1-phosphate adenosyltransferase
VVFTNGCFDIMHRGHATYLAQARTLGDLLVVGLNTDASVQRLKGPSRPINHQYDRAFLLASLACVDFVILFDEDTPEQLIHTVCPDILVKGGDYTLDTIVGADFVLQNGGTVTTIPFVDGYSTTSTLNKITQPL